MSDLLKEKELAERRKNDPVLNTSQDHLVRKLFSKFKKTSGGDLSSPHSVVSSNILAAERGAGGGGCIQEEVGNNNNNAISKTTNAATDSTIASPSASNMVNPEAKQRQMSLALGAAKTRTGGGGGWARLMVRISMHIMRPSNKTEHVLKKLKKYNSFSDIYFKGEGAGPTARTPNVKSPEPVSSSGLGGGSGWGKLKGTSAASTSDHSPTEAKLTLKHQDSRENTKKTTTSTPAKDENKSGFTSGSTRRSFDQNDIILGQSLTEFKSDIKKEVSEVHSKISNMEDLLKNILKNMEK